MPKQGVFQAEGLFTSLDAHNGKQANPFIVGLASINDYLPRWGFSFQPSFRLWVPNSESVTSVGKDLAGEGDDDDDPLSPEVGEVFS
jgi:hypothetical protein